jgi:uncharacterized protein
MMNLILSVVLTWTVVNILKPFIIWIKEGRINRDTIIRNGGMPSGHTALVSSLTMAIFLETGLSALFLVALVLTFVVIYDAVSIRMIIERQSKIINQLTQNQEHFPRLVENVGHTPMEVGVSILLSVIIPLLVYSL